ncbi:MAG TPA: flagellar basal-body rod protein FlgF [Syntrophales bacterium]|nr:flagellar basal-body rod protein FlgF [Syntrophales bacterium]
MRYEIGEMAKVCEERISQLDAVTHNLANINTPGFKFENLYFAAKNKDVKSDASAHLFSPLLSVDYSQGILQKTDNTLDVAIQGDGFFTIQTKNGPAYTRKGNFTVDKNNRLITQSGDYVLGKKGPIVINGKDVNIDKEGNITVDGNNVDKLSIVNFDDVKAIEKYGEGLFIDPGKGGMRRLENPEVISRHLELSNVNATNEMVKMINIQRSFESYQKVIQMMEEMDKLSTGRLGRLA